MSEGDDVGIGGGIGAGKSFVAITIVGRTSKECREELLMFLKMWGKRCGVRIKTTTVTRKKKRKTRKKGK
jgi:hypothetical protein